jgi:hypothetical protein
LASVESYLKYAEAVGVIAYQESNNIASAAVEKTSNSISSSIPYTFSPAQRDYLNQYFTMNDT